MKIGTNYSSNSPRQNTPDFGALQYVPGKRKLAKILGRPIEDAEKLIAMLGTLAKNVDIFVYAKRKGIDIYVQNVTPPIAEGGNKAIRFIRKCIQQVQMSRMPYLKSTVDYKNNNFGDALITEIFRLKEEFFSYGKKKIETTQITSVSKVLPIDHTEVTGLYLLHNRRHA